MPLIRYEIRNEYSLANPEVYRAAPKDDPEALLEAVAMAGLVGIVRQLGDLAEFAAEVFHDLHEEVMATAARSHELVTRVQQLEAELPAVEKVQFSEDNQLRFAYTQGAEWHASIYIDQNLLTQGDFPWFIRNYYEECRGPPRLFLLDKFDVAGAGACLKRYTDPSFFKTEWASTELLKAEKEKQDKKTRKFKKKGRWRKIREAEGTFFIQMYPRMENSSLGLKLPSASVNPSKGVVPVLRQHETTCLAFEKIAIGDFVQGSSSKSAPAYNGNAIVPDLEGHLSSVETIVSFGNSDSIKVSEQDVECIIQKDQIADLSVKEDLEPHEKPSLDDDDAASDTEQFVDALATIESEAETDTESNPKPDSVSYTEVTEIRCLNMSTSEENHGLHEHAFEADIPGKYSDAEKGFISTTPAIINPEALLEEEKVSVFSTSLLQNRMPSPFLDKNNSVLEKNAVSHSSSTEGKQCLSVDENSANPLLEQTGLAPLVNENSLFSHDDNSTSLYENSLALSFDESRAGSSFDENNLSSDGNNAAPIIGDESEVPDEHSDPSSLAEINRFPIFDKNDAVLKVILQTETTHAFPTQEELATSTVSIDSEMNSSSISFHLLPEPAIPLASDSQNGKSGSLGSLSSHRKVMPNELLVEVASTSTHETASLRDSETGLAATARKLCPESAETYMALPLSTDSLAYQNKFSQDEDDFDIMMQVSSTASSSSHSIACTPLIGVNGYSIDSDSESKSPLSSQLSLDSSPGSPSFSVLRSPTSPVKLPIDLVMPLELHSKLLTVNSPTLSPMPNLAGFSSSSSSSSSPLLPEPPSPPHTSVICPADIKENKTQIIFISSPSQEMLELPESPPLAPMVTSEPCVMQQNYQIESPVVSSNDLPITTRSLVLMPMNNAEHLQLQARFIFKQPVPRVINDTSEQKEQLNASTSMGLTFLPGNLLVATTGVPNHVVTQEKLSAPPIITITEPAIKLDELQSLAGPPTLHSFSKEEELPLPPPLPPLQWCLRSHQVGIPLSASKTIDQSSPPHSSSLDSLHTVQISEPHSPPALPVSSRKLQSNRGKDELIEAIASHNKSLMRKVTNQYHAPIPKPLDEREMLLEQIRTRSFSLRHTTVEKHEAPRPATNINVAAILEKANAIRQAFVGSDDEEDDWSDS